MLKIQSADGHDCFIAHLHKENIHTLEVIQQRFNGEVGLWDCVRREWIAIADLELSTAREIEKV